MANGKRSQANKIDIAQRRIQSLELRKRGYSLRAIADALDVTAPTVQRDIEAMLKQLNDEAIKETALLREMELQRLDDMWKSLHKQIDGGNFGAIDRALKIMERRAKLLGLDAPTQNKHEVEMPQAVQALEMLSALSQQAGVTMEALLEALAMEAQRVNDGS